MIFLPGGSVPLNIKNASAHRLAKELADLTGKSITEAVTDAIGTALDKVKSLERASAERLISELDDIALHCSSLEIIDERTADEILGYNEDGVSE
jgi:antitoxin VapB